MVKCAKKWVLSKDLVNSDHDRGVGGVSKKLQDALSIPILVILIVLGCAESPPF